MNTISVSASACKYVYPPSSSTWRDKCYQGQYNGSSLKMGAMLFSSLRDGRVDWSNQRIESIKLTATYAGAGASREKTIGLYIGTKTALSGSGDAMRGTFCGNVLTNGTAYNTTRTITFNSSTNAAAFAVLADWLVNGTSTTLAIYRNETAGSSYSTNYLAITSATMLIEYEIAGSYGELDYETIELGGTNTLRISPIDTAQTLTHKVVWRCGTQFRGVNLPSGTLTDTLSFFTSWHDQIDGTSGTAYCELHTIMNGIEKSVMEIPFTVTIPANWTSTIPTFDVERYSSHLDDQGHTVYEADPMGTKVWVSLSVSTLGYNSSYNKPTYTLSWDRSDNDARYHGQVTGTISSATWALTHDRNLVSGNFDVAYGWTFRLTVTNGHSTVDSVDEIGNGSPIIHISGNAKGVAIGGFSHATSALNVFECNYISALTGGLLVSGLIFGDNTNDWTPLTVASGVTTPGTSNLGDGVLRYKKIGSLIVVRGGVDVASGQDIVTQMPYAPARGNHYVLAPCSGANIARLYVNPEGLFRCEWIRKLSDGNTYSGTIWVDCAMTYWIT